MKRLAPWAPAFGWALFLLWLGGRPTGAGIAIPGLDKVAHFGLYGVLGGLAGRGWLRAARMPGALVVVLAACAVGVIDELHQIRVPGRTADPLDFVADAAGVLIGFAAGRRRPARGKELDSECPM